MHVSQLYGVLNRCSPQSTENRNKGEHERTRQKGRERRASSRFARLHSASLLRIFAAEMETKGFL